MILRKLIFTIFLLPNFFGFLNANEEIEELKKRICAVQPQIDGWCSKEKAINFIDLVLEVKPKVCVEIGVFAGSSVFPVASTLKFLNEGIIIAIDPWNIQECIKYFDPVNDAASIAWWSGINLGNVYSLYLKMLNGYELEKYCATFKMTSEKAAPAIAWIDILYIDGSTGEEGSLNDVRLYLPKVRGGGYIWINNTASSERKPSLELLAAFCDHIKTIDNGSCMLFKKKMSES